MNMEAYDAYIIYIALKSHFNSDYDFNKYNGKVSASFDFKVLSKANIEKSFAKFSGAINTFVNTLLTVAAFQTLSNLI